MAGGFHDKETERMEREREKETGDDGEVVDR